jgi:hypothetical protein
MEQQGRNEMHNPASFERETSIERSNTSKNVLCIFKRVSTGLPRHYKQGRNFRAKKKTNKNDFSNLSQKTIFQTCPVWSSIWITL